LTNKNIIIRKTPFVADYDLSDDVIAFIQAWSAMIDWNKYKAIIFVDVANIFFLLFSIKNDALENCYVAKLIEDLWYMELDRVKTWDRINNLISILETKNEITLGGFFNGIPGNS